MPRWEPNARQRLERVALDLYSTRGYDETTVGHIAERAGVTSRTYFRYFPDKREVLFAGAERLAERMVQSVRDADDTQPPLTVALGAMGALDDLMQDRGFLRRREAVINSSPELRERETMKLAALSVVVAQALTERGTDDDTARLVADVAIVIFQRASRVWMDDASAPFRLLLEREADRVRDVIVAHAAEEV